MRRSIFVLVFISLCAAVFGENQPQAEYEKKLEALRELKAKEKFAVNPTSEIVFPQVANGISGDLGIITSLVLTSNEATSFAVTLTFRDVNGFPLFVELFDSTTELLVTSGSTLSVTVPPFETVFLETSGVGNLVVGWASASAPGRLMGGVAAFQLIDVQTQEFLTVVGVGESSASPAFSTPVFRDVSLNSNTSIALANNSDTTARLEIFLIENNGGTDSTIISIGPRQQLSRFIDEIFPSIGSIFSGLSMFLGSMRMERRR